MAKAKKPLADDEEQKGNGKRNGEKIPKLDLHPETKKSVLAVIFFVCAIIFVCAYFGYAGMAGAYVYDILHALLGAGYFLVPLAFVMIGVGFLRSLHSRVYFTSVLGGTLFVLSFLGLIDIIARSANHAQGYPAGFIGFGVGAPFLYLFGLWVSVLIFIALGLISVSISFNFPLFFRREKKGEEADEGAETMLSEEDEESEFSGTIEDIEKERGDRFAVRMIGDTKEKEEEPEEEKKEKKRDEPPIKKEISQSTKASEFVVETHQNFYQIPPLDLLEKDTGKPNSGDIEAYAEVIQKTFKHFGIDVEMGEVNVGPTVTQYTLKPAHGVKLSRIIALSNDLSLALAAHPLRIEAPIPGRSLVGIEIPNKAITLVRLFNLIDSPAFVQAPPLTVALGRDVSGNPQYMDVEKMPHLLVAGATGSGKSVCLHVLLTSLLYKNFPQMVKFIIIDPKRIELAAYNGIPHLLAPVIIDRGKAIAALRWATGEMERRYEYLAQFKVRNISSYNAQVARGKEGTPIMPYILIVIDELADLMLAAPKEVEASIVRLAQMSRAVGIHLIISTQRPSVEVITGLIKANIPCRISFQVASLVDSRTILDASGAEKLLGNGDMLFLPPDASKPKRIQGAFVSEKEVKRITDHIREAAERAAVTTPAIPEPVQQSITQALEKPARASESRLENSYADNGSDEELLLQAKEVIARAQKASSSLLQRRLKLGYARAARLIDLLEEEGVIGPQEGARPREVYLKPKEDDADHADDDQ